MKKRRKTIKCLNCEQTLQEKHNYCPNCGQENTNNEVNIGLLLREFTSNVFSFDSRFAHTIKPFLFNPGKITEAFISGKRVFYANPIRWYLVISIFHFFFFSKLLEPSVKDQKIRGFMGDQFEELSIEKYDSLYNLPDSLHSDDWPFSNRESTLIAQLNETTNLDADQVMDSLAMDDYHWAKHFIVHQYIKINRQTNATLNNYILRQIPIIIFFILPVYAFLLKLLFWRRGLYIKHLIHSIHIHSFLFFLLSWVWIFSLLIDGFKQFGIPISMILTTVYIIFSFKKVYKVKKRWALFRLSVINFLYMFALSICLLLGVVISLALL